MKQMKRKENFQRSAGPLMKPFSFVFDHFLLKMERSNNTWGNMPDVCKSRLYLHRLHLHFWLETRLITFSGILNMPTLQARSEAGSYNYWASQKVKGAAEFRLNVQHSPVRCCQGWLMHLYLNLYHSCNWTLILLDHLALWHRPYCVMAGVKPRSWRVTQTHVIKSAFPCVNKSKVTIWQLNKDVWRVMRRIFIKHYPTYIC